MDASSLRSSLTLAAITVPIAFALGCPVYSDSYGYGGCYYATDCQLGYRCTADGRCVRAPGLDAGSYGDAAVPDAPAADAAPDAPVMTSDGSAVVVCANPNDCTAEETCSVDGTCRAGDCSTNGCVNQFQCATVTAGNSAVACVHGDSQACGSDHQCAKSARCVDGRCTAIEDLCTDRSQCPNDDACVDGKCVATCTNDSQCPSGYLCRTALQVCDAVAKACSVTSDCGTKDLACVDGACVPRCGAIGACRDGGASACVDNGCIPSQKVISVCPTDGSTMGCGVGQICLHHACYTSCQAPSAAACDALAATPLCKGVTVGGTAHSVCATTTTLGSECDLTANKPCSGAQTCIDGFCR